MHLSDHTKHREHTYPEGPCRMWQSAGGKTCSSSMPSSD